MRQGVRFYLLKWLAGVAVAGLVAGCGFQLRGQSQLPFTAAYVEGGDSTSSNKAMRATLASQGSSLAKALRAALASQGKLAEKAEAATVIVRLANEEYSKTILALSGRGKVKEYRLGYRFTLSALDAGGRELIVPAEIQLIRDFSYDDQQLLAKEAEEAGLIRGMEQDALRQVLKRLSYVQR